METMVHEKEKYGLQRDNKHQHKKTSGLKMAIIATTVVLITAATGIILLKRNSNDGATVQQDPITTVTPVFEEKDEEVTLAPTMTPTLEPTEEPTPTPTPEVDMDELIKKVMPDYDLDEIVAYLTCVLDFKYEGYNVETKKIETVSEALFCRYYYKGGTVYFYNLFDNELVFKCSDEDAVNNALGYNREIDASIFTPVAPKYLGTELSEMKVYKMLESSGFVYSDGNKDVINNEYIKAIAATIGYTTFENYVKYYITAYGDKVVFHDDLMTENQYGDLTNSTGMDIGGSKFIPNNNIDSNVTFGYKKSGYYNGNQSNGVQKVLSVKKY
ncbi:MAG TPA: hypothetical protein PLC53_02265, partial [Bacilli bacterium]|nr:hypothetical protein [Bacilli bacterium]